MLSALRYYDPARDFQPGLQYAGTVDDSSRTLQFPGVFDAGDALSLARRANVRARAAAPACVDGLACPFGNQLLSRELLALLPFLRYVAFGHSRPLNPLRADVHEHRRLRLEGLGQSVIDVSSCLV